LADALSKSPSGKLGFAPEIEIPEPQDPTAVLLQSNAIQTISRSMRQIAKANAVFLQSDDITDVATFCNEQSNSLGQFPGPVPVVYILPNKDDDADPISCSSIAQAGVDGILIHMDQWNAPICTEALSFGMEPIPEIPIDTSTENVLESLEQIVSKISDTLGKDPVCLVLTPQPDTNNDSSSSEIFSLPSSLTASRSSTSSSVFPRMSSIPLWVSVRVVAGDDRLGKVAQLCKQRGLTGCLLRRECLPGGFHTYQNNPKSSTTTHRGAAQPNYLDVVRSCWEAILGDLKSTRSKSFSFRSKNNLERSAASKWGSLQRSVLESGALGDPNESVSIVDSDAGDYQGFA
jgi:hypothetical protein